MFIEEENAILKKITTGSINIKDKFRQFVAANRNKLSANTPLPVEDLNNTLNEEREYLKIIKNFKGLIESKKDSLNFEGDWKEGEEDSHWRIVWSSVKSNDPKKVENDKKIVETVMKKLVATKSRYLGVGLGNKKLFLSKTGTITTIDVGSDILKVVWSDVKTLEKEIRDSEIRIETLNNIINKKKRENTNKQTGK
jgi:hypothetical protein